MQRLTLAGGVTDSLRGGIVALGNFDGFHLGHQAVVGRAIQRAFHERRPVIVATFDPHPVKFFKPDLPPFRLTTLDQRETLFAHAGADAMLVFEFDGRLASMEAEEFVADCSHSTSAPPASSPATTSPSARAERRCPAARHAGPAIWRHRRGRAPVLLDGERISSGRVREALVAGDTGTATHC